MNHEERNQLAVDNLPLVGYLVSEICAKAPHLSREDLAAAGALALVTCARSFDPEQGVKFGTYARRRILGAFADEMRSGDWAGRDTRRKIKAVQAVSETLTAELGRTPTAAELSAALGLPLEEVQGTLADASRTVAELDETASGSLPASSATPEESVLAGEQTHFLRAAVAALPEKMRYIVEQTYFEDRSVKELAVEFGSTHSAVSQQRTEAIRLLRDGMATHYANDDVQRAPESRVSAARHQAYLATMAARVSARVAVDMMPGMAAATA
ncbi:FliA/WhiG subfamily RNA polymerase sigma-28 subunit [Arthrobacter crystallopoietes BAB-32]|uniref:FliA/WhiG subfamily RNA polymerase sigma-28 subunit n=1 Tax=Arthrobacter crystallopoietes BAB-32 TaxID=1246476 RepID=N1V7V0_9MICC|nr:sigma-70 family RNA polymerase sigma factor [Arthrobacter crystallopoietes]EMY34298.1 FliA/WhiG subfamily RNA polymerase sigma-28 subunit [Arthrobacter crystallopoietes BAB-32]